MPAAALLAMATLLSGAGGAQAGEPPWPRCVAWRERPELLRELETALARAVARRRRVNRLAPLTRESRLDAVARDHARAMAASGRLSHRSPERGNVETRLGAAGVFDWSRVGENLAVAPAAKYRASTVDGRYRSVGCHEAQALARELVAGWDLSPGHRETMLGADYSHLGSGAAYDPGNERIYVAHVFVRRSTCGYRSGPCCSVEGHAGPGACRVGLRCAGGRCAEPP